MEKKPWVQVAIDALTLDRAAELVQIASGAGADWIEAGTPLLAYEGIRSIAAVAEMAQGRPVVADFKATDGVAKYFKKAGELGASVATVLACAPVGSVKAAITGGREGGVRVMVDLLALSPGEMASRASAIEALGVDYFLIHLGHDQATDEPARTVLDGLDEVVSAVTVPVGISTFTTDEAVEAVRRGASFIVQGEPILSAPDSLEQLTRFVEKVKAAGG